MIVGSEFQRANRQISRLSRMIANNLSFRRQFEGVLSSTGNRVIKMRRLLRKNGITFPFRISFNAPGSDVPKVTILANVIDISGNVGTNVGYTFQLLPL